MRTFLLATAAFAAVGVALSGCAALTDQGKAARTVMSGDCQKIKAELAALGEPVKIDETAETISDVAKFVPLVGGFVVLGADIASGNMTARRQEADRATLQWGLRNCETNEKWGEMPQAVPNPPKKK